MKLALPDHDVPFAQHWPLEIYSVTIHPAGVGAVIGRAERALDPGVDADLNQPIPLDEPVELGYGRLATELDILAGRGDFAVLDAERQFPLEWPAMHVKAVLPAFVGALPSALQRIGIANACGNATSG